MNNTSIHFLYNTVLKSPDKACAIDDQGTITFANFFTKAYCIAKLLGQQGILNQPILVYLPKGNAAIISFAASLLSGNFYVPIDIKSPQKRIRTILSNLQPRIVISSITLKERLQELGIPLQDIIFLENIDYTSTLFIEAMIEECKSMTDQIIDCDPCYIMFTSGSTGTPKGVVVPHRGVMDYIEWAIACLQVDNSDIIGNQAPLFFDNSTLDIYLSWATGATINFIPESLFLFPIKLIEYLENNQITFIFFVPSVLVSVSKMQLLSPERLPSLRKIVFAGEVMPTKHLAYWQTQLPNKSYINLYGPTEITVDCTYFFVDRIYNTEETLPIGYPCQNSGVIILTNDNRLAKNGEQGELCVRGSSLALGYWNAPEKTEEVFCQNPLQKNYADRIYRTGDLVMKNEKGQILFIGRIDSQIKHMGYRIELGEIETAADALHCIDKCCILYNQQSKEIVLFYESMEEQTVATLKKGLSEQLPNYMIPRKYIYLQKLPINANGKIDRKSLAEKLQ